MNLQHTIFYFYSYVAEPRTFPTLDRASEDGIYAVQAHSQFDKRHSKPISIFCLVDINEGATGACNSKLSINEHQLITKQQRVRYRVPTRRCAWVHHHRTFATQFQTGVVPLVETSSARKYSDTCYKYCAKSRGEKRTCRASEFLFRPLTQKLAIQSGLKVALPQ